MFRHHKYCVIEVSGQLVVEEGRCGMLDMYLLDSTSDAGGQGKRIRIIDPGLIELIRRMLPCGSDKPGLRCHARVAGTLDMDGGEVQLSFVSQAFIHGKEGLLKYEPQ